MTKVKKANGASARSFRMNFIVIDTETLGLKDNAVVLSVGAVFYDLLLTIDEHGDRKITYALPCMGPVPDSGQHVPDSGQHVPVLEQHVPVLEQIMLNRTVEPDTVKFWGSDADRLNNMILEHKPVGRLEDVIHRIHNWLMTRMSIDTLVFERSKPFDSSKLESLFSAFNLETPWKFWQLHETRSFLYAINKSGSQTAVNKNKHSAISDATADAESILSAIHVAFKAGLYDEYAGLYERSLTEDEY